MIAALSRSSCNCFRNGSANSLFVQSSEPLINEKSPFPWDRFRLPSNLAPTRYNITLTPDWNGASPEGLVPSFEGQVQIYMNVRQATDNIILNAKDLSIKHHSLHQFNSDGSLGECISIATIRYENDRLEMMYLGLHKTLQAGQAYVLKLNYTGIVSKSLNGLYSSSYIDSNEMKQYLLSTQFEPNYARRVFPSFDEPAYKATFEINLVRPEHLKSLSNMPLISSQPLPPANNSKGHQVKLYLDRFEESVIMSSYLLAFVICDFKSVSSKTLSNTLVSVYAPPKQSDQTDFALKVAVDALNFFEDYFAIKFPLPKIDLIAIPDFSVGAMENWGLVTYRMVDLLYKPNVTSQSAKQRVAIVVAHELAHQWFGNLVTMAWWNDLWLNEGFASYMEYVCTNAIFPTWNMLEQFSSNTAPAAFSLDALSSSHPVSFDIEDPNSIQAIFDYISYNKGALILRMIDGPVMPHSSFKKGLHAYLSKYAYKNAESQDLWRALQEAWDEDRRTASTPLPLSRIDLESFMSGWINQKGFPLITSTDPQTPMTGDSSGGPVINLYQSKFVSQHQKIYNASTGEKRVENDDFTKYLWQIPFDLALGVVSQNDNGVKNESIWMKNGNSSFGIDSLAPDIWMKGNLLYAGYYLVNYGPMIWENLRSRLVSRPDSLTSMDRTQLIDNAYFLDKFGYTKAVDTLKFYTYVNPSTTPSKYTTPSKLGLKEKDPIPLIAMLNSLSATRYRFHSDDQAYNNLWPTFINKLLLKDLLEIYDWHKDLPHLESFLQSALLDMAVSIGNEETINKARPIFNQLIYQPTNGSDYVPYPDLITTILTAGIEYGTKEDWEMAWKAYQGSNVPSEKDEILNALGTTRDPNLLSKFLQYSLNMDLIPAQDMYLVISQVASNAMGGSQLAWDFVRTQWPIIEERFGDNSASLGEILESVCKTFDNPTQAKEFESFVALHSSQLPTSIVDQTRETIELNVAWLANNGASVKAWLMEHQ